MNQLLPGISGLDREEQEKATLMLRRLGNRWRPYVLNVYLFRLAQFVINASSIVLIARLTARIAVGTATPEFWQDARILAALLSLKAVIAYLMDRATGRFTGRIIGEIRTILLEELEKQLSFSSASSGTGALAAAFGEKAEALAPYFTRYFPQLYLSVTAPVLVVGYIFSLNRMCGVILVLTLPLIPVYMILTGKGTAAAARDRWQELSQLGDYFFDRLKGVTTLFLYGRLPDEVDHVAQASTTYGEKAFTVLRIAFLSSAVLDFFSTIVIAGEAIYIGLNLLHYIPWGSTGNFTLAKSLAILMLVPDFLSALKTLGAYYHDRAMAIGAIVHFREEGLLRSLEKRHMPDNDGHAAPTWHGARPAAVQVENLSFGYPGKRLLFEALTLNVSPGEKIILRGRNGSGKSTLFSLLLGHLAPTAGRVLLDGTPTTLMGHHAIPDRISWTGQHPYIFNGTLRDNLLMGDAVDDDTIFDIATQYFDITAFFLSFPDGLDTLIADDGRSVSGGERRKIALLRAVIKEAGIILLDEPFAGLDQAATNRFITALLRSKADKTIILILHGDPIDDQHFTTIPLHEIVEVFSGVV